MNDLNLKIKPLKEADESNCYKMLEITTDNKNVKYVEDCVCCYGIDLHLDVDADGTIHLWSHDIQAKFVQGWRFDTNIPEFDKCKKELKKIQALMDKHGFKKIDDYLDYADELMCEVYNDGR